MIKKLSIIYIGIIFNAYATDFSQMSLEELNSMRTQISVEDKEAFRQEVQKRVKLMSKSQRTKFVKERQHNVANQSMTHRSSYHMQECNQKLQDVVLKKKKKILKILK